MPNTMILLPENTAIADASHAYVSLLLRGDTTFGANTFFDYSANNRTVFPLGAPVNSAAAYGWPFRDATVMAFNGTSDSLEIAPTILNGPDFDFGTGAFSVDVSVYLTSLPAVKGEIFSCWGWSNSERAFTFYVSATGAVRFQINAVAGNYFLDSTTLLVPGRWYHLAYSRGTGNNIRLAVDGVIEAWATTTVDIRPPSAIPIGGSPPNIIRVGARQYDNTGATPLLDYFFPGYIADLRVTKGTNLFGTDFAVPTARRGWKDASWVPASPPWLVATGTNANQNPSLSFGLTGPSLTAVGYGGAQSAMSVPVPTVYAVGHDSSGEKAFIYTAPAPTLSAYGGANSALTAPAMSLAITGTVVNMGTSALVGPSLVVAASGTSTVLGRAALTFGTVNGPNYSLIGYSGAVCSITLNDGVTIAATGPSGNVGRATLTLPLFELDAAGTAQNYGSAALLAPMLRAAQAAQAYLMPPMGVLTAIGTATITATYEAYAVNLKHTPRPGVEPFDEMTRYTNYPFTHIVRYKNSYYGVNNTGLYLLEGTTDYDAVAPTPVPWEWHTATTDFDGETRGTIVSAYFGGRMGPAATITIHAGENAGVAYSFTTPRNTLAKNYRQKLGKGIKQRYQSLSAAGAGVLELDELEFEVQKLTRRM